MRSGLRSRVASAVLAALLVAVGCESSSDPDAAPTETPVSTPEPDTTPTFGGDSAGDGVIDTGEILSSGRQRTSSFRPRVSFDVPDLGQPARVLTENERLVLMDVGGRTQVFLANPEKVFTFPGAKLSPRPEDLNTWVQSVPHLRIRRRGRVTGGSLQGTVYEGDVTGSLAVPELCPIDCFPLVPLGTGKRAVFAVEGQSLMVFVLGEPGRQLLVMAIAIGRLDKSLSRRLTKLVESVRIET